MTKKLTTEEFIQRAKEVHGDKYDYSFVEYIDSKTKVKILCQDHGRFEQAPAKHINGLGCRRCSYEFRSYTRAMGVNEFLKRAREVHGNKYDYSLVEYKNSKTKVKIICPVHGVFEQTPSSHCSSSGCNVCRYQKHSKNLMMSLCVFIEKSKSIHGNKYDYSLVEYKNSKTKVKIICPVHGVFEQTPSSHLNGSGCLLCRPIRTTDSEFISKCNKKHDNKYDYSKVSFNGVMEDIDIVCPKHGTFTQKAYSHLAGHGCQKCSGGASKDEKDLANYLKTQQFISKAREIHGDKYDYSFVEYKNSKTKVKILCKDHGVFEQRPTNHLQGHGCYTCRNTEISNAKTKTTTQFKNLVQNTHDGKYDYSLVEYVNNKTKVKIVCPIHGEFEQIARNHLYLNHDCPRCSRNGPSNGELELGQYIDKNVLTNDRTIIPPQELDIVIPEKRIAIEFDGLYWHSEEMGKDKNYHLNKTIACEKVGYQLIHVFSNEWTTKTDIVKSRIDAKLGNIENRIYARKCKVVPVSKSEHSKFMDMNHIQGRVGCNVAYGLVYDDTLVAVMSFGKTRYSSKCQWELLRFANKINTIVVGGASKLFYYFTKNHTPTSIISYSDKRWNSGKLYTNLGFEHSHTSQPNYWYFKKDRPLLFSRVKFQKHKLRTILDSFKQDLTEVENMRMNGYYRIFDCGNDVFIWNNTTI